MDPSQGASDFLQVLQSCLGNTIASAESANISTPPKPTSPQPNRLIQAVYFTRLFIPTYLIVFVSVVLIGYIRLRRVRSRYRRHADEYRRSEKSVPSTPPSERNVVVQDENALSKTGTVTERTVLLDRSSVSVANASFLTRLSCRARSILLYQPKAIPAMTARANNLPANGTSLLVVLFLAINVFYLLHNIEFSKAMVFAFAGRAGALFVANLPIVYILGAKNNQPIMRLTGWSYEKLNIYHRRLGEWMTILALVHFVGMLFTFDTIIKPFGYSWQWFFALPIIALGTSALASYLAIWATSVGYIRNMAYEFFLASHIFLQVATLFLLFFHHSATRLPVGAALLIWSLDRIITRMVLSNKKFVATFVIAEDKNTVLLYCDIPIDRSQRRSIRGGWRAGQHIFLSVPGIRWYHAYQAHPFTIASPAPSNTLDGGVHSLQLIIRCKDGFSKELLEFVEFHQHAEVYLDGPYGSQELEEAVLTADRACLIAGGSGISLTYPLAWSRFTRGRESSTVSSRTLYVRGKKQNNQVRLRVMTKRSEQLHLWFRRSSMHSSWVTTFPCIHEDLSTRPGTQEDENGIDLISQVFNTQQDTTSSRPDVSTELRLWLESPGKDGCAWGESVCLVVCGPEGLVREVQNFASILVKEGYNIDLHVEKFSW